MSPGIPPAGAVCVLAVFLLLAPSNAAGQTRAEDDPRATARMHVGPFYLTPAIAVSSLGVDTNVFNQSDDPQSDFTFSLAPQADVWVPFVRRALVQFSAVVGMDYYQKFASERSINPDLTGRGELYFNRLTLFGEGSYLNTRQRPSFEIDVRARRVEDDFGGGAEVRVLPKLSLEASGRQRRIRFDADAYLDGSSLQQTLDRHSTAFAGAVRWRMSVLTTFEVRAERLADRFVYSPERDTDSLRVAAGAQFRPRALVSGSGHVGFRNFTSVSGTLPDYQGLVALATLSYRLRGTTVFGFTADRDVDYSYEPTQPYYVRAGYGFSIRQQITEQFDLSFGAARYTYTYKDLVGADRAAVERVDVNWSYTGSIGYRVGRDSRIGFGVSYYDRMSKAKSSFNCSGLRAGLLMEYGTR